MAPSSRKSSTSPERIDGRLTRCIGALARCRPNAASASTCAEGQHQIGGSNSDIRRRPSRHQRTRELAYPHRDVQGADGGHDALGTGEIEGVARARRVVGGAEHPRDQSQDQDDGEPRPAAHEHDTDHEEIDAERHLHGAQHSCSIEVVGDRAGDCSDEEVWGSSRARGRARPMPWSPTARTRRDRTAAVRPPSTPR